jgi:glycosyltransferase involved in cell wall biosynthesis
MEDKVSVIIPTYNRFKYLLNSINSVRNQTYKNIEIIVINDCSTQKEYYNHNFGDDVNIIHLIKNSRFVTGFPCAGYVRNQGIKIATGKYIAFLDDDDIWLPNKLEIQIKKMKEKGFIMSCTDGLIGNGIFNGNVKSYKKYNAEHYFDTLINIYKEKGKEELLSYQNGFPEVWDFYFLSIHNCCICSSIVVEKKLLDKIQNFRLVKNGQEDYDCWLRCLQNTKCLYLTDVCVYYDIHHGDGKNY